MRESWEERAFRNLPGDEDLWFLWDRLRLGVAPLPVAGLTEFLAVRHQGGSSDRGHTWPGLPRGRLQNGVVDADPGQRREHLGQEGVPPLELLARGRAELSGYGGELRTGRVVASFMRYS